MYPFGARPSQASFRFWQLLLVATALATHPLVDPGTLIGHISVNPDRGFADWSVGKGFISSLRSRHTFASRLLTYSTLTSASSSLHLTSAIHPSFPQVQIPRSANQK